MASFSSHKLQSDMHPWYPDFFFDTQILASLLHKGSQESLKSSWFPVKGREDEVVLEMYSSYQKVRMLSKMSADTTAGACASRGVPIKGPEEKIKIWSEAWVYNFTQNEHEGISMWKRGICGFPTSPEERYISYKLALAMGTCHLPLQGLNHVLLTFHTPWKEFGVQSRNYALCAGRNTGRAALQIVRYFQKPILLAQFLYLLISRKAL